MRAEFFASDFLCIVVIRDPVRCRIDTIKKFFLQGVGLINLFVTPRTNRRVLQVIVNAQFLSRCVALQLPSKLQSSHALQL